MPAHKAYLPDFIFGAIDGLVTTFAVVSGVEGAALPTAVILILGFANLIADGFSMAASNYLHSRSERDLAQNIADKKHHMSAYVTFASFVSVGIIPLLPFMLRFGKQSFPVAAGLTLAAFFGVGYVNGIVTKKNRLAAALQTLLIGASAAALAYVIGRVLSRAI